VRRSPRGHGPRSYDVRLHCMFADADPVIARALARYVADNDRDASRVLGDFIDANADAVRGRRRPAAPVLITTGDHHDLRAIFDELNDRYFAGAIDAAITWGQRTGAPRRRASIKMGSYSVEERLIRIHRALDRAFVPRFFVEWIVFHEMLHQVHDIKVRIWEGLSPNPPPPGPGPRRVPLPRRAPPGRRRPCGGAEWFSAGWW
jgi:hypothetical protein